MYNSTSDASSPNEVVAIKAGLTASSSSKKPRFIADSGGVGLAFDLAVPSKGSYYIRAWAAGVNGQNQIAVYLDTAKQPMGYVNTTDSGWQFYRLKTSANATTFSLAAGSHTFTFKAKGDHVPDVEFIEISNTSFVPSDSDTAYSNFISDLKSRKLGQDYRSQKQSGSLPENTAAVSINGPNPSDNYCYALDQGVVYTYKSTFYLTAGQYVVFETRNADPYASDPVMYLFQQNNPGSQYSWSNDDYNGYQSRIAVTIPATDNYMLVARSYNPTSPGTSDLYKDGSLYASSIALWGNKLDCSLGKTGTQNYFTSKLRPVTGGTPDSVLFLVENVGSWPYLIHGYNDDYSGIGDFSWGLQSRVRTNLAHTLSYAIFSSYSSSNPWGYADVYLENNDSDIMPSFPNLKADDAIKSAPSTGGSGTPGAYNCISYSGGVTSTWIWPLTQGSPWWDPNPLTAFDNYYGNNPPRPVDPSVPVINYTRSGATYNNSALDLWALNGSYTHGSVQKPGNGWPHGYDWESKPGSLTRTFHPRRSLRGNSYGDVVAYYIQSGAAAAALTPEMIEVERPVLTQAESSKLQTLKDGASVTTTDQFEKLYAAWKSTWGRPEIAVHSDPRMYAQSPEYSSLLEFCKQQGRTSWPLLFKKYTSGEFFAFIPIQDVTLPEYSGVLEKIRKESATERYTADGKYIGPSLEANMMKFVKELIVNM